MSYDEQFPSQNTNRYVPQKSNTTRNCCLFAGGGCGCLTVIFIVICVACYFFFKGSFGGLIIAQVNTQVLQQAFDLYAQEHGEYPPAYSVDENGKPLHSWRVLILPYLAEAQKHIDKSIYNISPEFAKDEDIAVLAEEIRLNEAWDSEHNKQFVSKMPLCFLNAALKEKGRTNFQMIVGAKCLSDGAGTRTAEEVASKNQTVYFVEAAPSVNWMEPKDLKYEDFIANETVSVKGEKAGLTCPHPFASVVMFGNAAISNRVSSMYFSVKNATAQVRQNNNQENVVTIENIRDWAVFDTEIGQAEKSENENEPEEETQKNSNGGVPEEVKELFELE